jgi:hypothetical protein
MTAVETLIEFGLSNFGKTKIIPPETFDDPELRFVIDAMEAYGKQEYNQGVNDCITNAKVVQQALSDRTAYMVDTLSLENLKK